MKTTIATVLLLAGLSGPAFAQGLLRPQGLSDPRLSGSVPVETVLDTAIPLSLNDAIQRGLKYNLGVVTGQEGVEAARGARVRALADLLPHVGGRFAQNQQQINLEAFGFPVPPGASPLIGPFGIWDARVSLSQALFDLRAIDDSKAGARRLEAAQFGYQDTRDMVVLVCANLYLQAVSAVSRVESARAQLATADELYRIASDRKQAGLVAGIEVLRANVQVETLRQRLIASEADLERDRLQLARAIGLPLSQAFTLSDTVPYAPLDAVTVDQALAQAYASRADYKQKQALVAAAEASRQAVSAERLPSLYLNADYGAIGPTLGGALPTFSVITSVRVPIFSGRAIEGRLHEADAALRQQQAELADLKGRIEYDVRAALLELKAVAELLKAAESRVALADAQLKQATDRFAAGVAGNLEVVDAQEAVATASEGRITTLYLYNTAKAALARAIGLAEEQAAHLLGETGK